MKVILNELVKDIRVVYKKIERNHELKDLTQVFDSEVILIKLRKFFGLYNQFFSYYCTLVTLNPSNKVIAALKEANTYKNHCDEIKYRLLNVFDFGDKV